MECVPASRRVKGGGWHTITVVLTPDELRQLLSLQPVRLVKTNGWVPLIYKETGLDEYVTAYARYLEEARTTNYNAHRSYIDIYSSVALPATRFVEAQTKSPNHKLLRPEEPVLELAPFTVALESERLFLRTVASKTAFLGLLISFPKGFYYREEDYAIVHSTQTTQQEALFLTYRDYLLRTTRPCNFDLAGRRLKTKIRASPQGRAIITLHKHISAWGLCLR